MTTGYKNIFFTSDSEVRNTAIPCSQSTVRVLYAGLSLQIWFRKCACLMTLILVSSEQIPRWLIFFVRCLRIPKKYNANDLSYMRNIMSRIIRFIMVTFWPKTSSTVHLKKVMKQVCAWATLASKRVVLSRRGREISEERNTGRGQEDEKEKTLKRLRLRGGWKKISLSSSSFFEEKEASEGRELEEDSNRQTQCHQVKLIIDDI